LAEQLLLLTGTRLQFLFHLLDFRFDGGDLSLLAGAERLEGRQSNNAENQQHQPGAGCGRKERYQGGPIRRPGLGG
jgi:hypothetical protein